MAAKMSTGRTVVKTTTKKPKVTTLKEVTVTPNKNQKIKTLKEITVKPKPEQMAKKETKKPTPQDNRMFLVGDPRKGKQRQVDINEYYRSTEKEGQGKVILRTDPKTGKPFEAMSGNKYYTNYIPMNKKG